MDRLDRLEAQSVYIFREAFNRIDKMALLWSLGKDSNVMVWLAKKAFLGHIPFPVMHVDTGKKFPEMYEFRDRYAEFQAADCEVLGVSRDSVRSHENFAAKYDFPFPLLSDKDERMCQAFGVIVQKKLYGREYLGVDRSTWLFDADGTLTRSWRKVRVKGHVAEVLEAVNEL